MITDSYKYFKANPVPTNPERVLVIITGRIESKEL